MVHRVCTSSTTGKNYPWEDFEYKALGLILAAILSLAVFGVAQVANDNFRVTLLGTGSPDPDPNRFSASTLIEAGNQLLARKPFKVVAVALANKMARTAWALLAKGGTYRAPALVAAA